MIGSNSGFSLSLVYCANTGEELEEIPHAKAISSYNPVGQGHWTEDIVVNCFVEYDALVRLWVHSPSPVPLFIMATHQFFAELVALKPSEAIGYSARFTTFGPYPLPATQVRQISSFSGDRSFIQTSNLPPPKRV